jgi:hypothetical protein
VFTPPRDPEMQAEPCERGPVVELSVMLNKHWRWMAQPSARDMHKSREGGGYGMCIMRSTWKEQQKATEQNAVGTD